MDSTFCQPGILAPCPAAGRSMAFRLIPEGKPAAALDRLCSGFKPDWGTIGLGEPLLRSLGGRIPGLRSFPGLSGLGLSVPSSQQALWIMLRGDESGGLFDLTERLKPLLEPAFVLADACDTFRYGTGRDLTGYEDGTANPTGEAAIAAALISGGTGLGGSSFAAVQRWTHDLQRFRAMPSAQRDAVIGRRLASNEEIDDAPLSAHVKRTAQETYDPPAFLLRRSMPWATPFEQGLEFIAYASSLDPFERMLRRMIGAEDGICDALFTFSRPLTGGYYWCPPLRGGQLELRALRI